MFQFTPYCDSFIKDDSCLSTVANAGPKCSVGEHTILSKTGDGSATKSFYVPTLDSATSDDKSVTWSDFVVSVDSERSIEYERMYVKSGTAKSLVGVSESKIPVELANEKVWQPCGVPCASNYYLY